MNSRIIIPGRNAFSNEIFDVSGHAVPEKALAEMVPLVGALINLLFVSLSTVFFFKKYRVDLISIYGRIV